VERVVGLLEEDALVPIAALRQAGTDDASDAGQHRQRQKRNRYVSPNFKRIRDFNAAGLALSPASP
jgi:hypothetical protein